MAEQDYDYQEMVLETRQVFSDEQEMPSSSSDVMWFVFVAYLVVEVLFGIIFYLYMVPRANRRTVASHFRDYGADRVRLLFRILDRTAEFGRRKGQCPREAIKQYVLGCFDTKENKTGADTINEVVSDSSGYFSINTTSASSSIRSSIKGKGTSLSSYLRQQSSRVPPLFRMSQESMGSSSSSSTEEESDDSKSISSRGSDEMSSSIEETVRDLDSTNTSTTWTIPGLHREEVDSLMSWSLFGKEAEDFEGWERRQKQECFVQMEKRLGLVFAAGSGNQYKPRRLNLEDVDPIHRPLLVYLIVIAIKIFVGCVLRLAGYQRVVSERTGLVAWYRPAAASSQEQQQQHKLMPMLFFHGIAPGGLLFYLPIILWGLCNDPDREVFLFECPNITCTIGFHTLNEFETADGAAEIVDRFVAPDQPLNLTGHSFGSFTMTWLLHSPAFRHRIKQFTLLDPVSILMSEKDIMGNFLYKKDISKFRMVAASELFIEYYLRRHLWFYNSELWLDDIPAGVQTLIALSGNDVIVNAPRVREFVDAFADDYFSNGAGSASTLKQIFWDGKGHGCCVGSPSKWREIKTAMLQQELAIVQNEQE